MGNERDPFFVTDVPGTPLLRPFHPLHRVSGGVQDERSEPERGGRGTLRQQDR